MTHGQLIVAAVPLGNPADVTYRVASLLANADVIAAEDTRRLRRLCADLEITPTGRIISCFDAVEARKAPELADLAQTGSTILFVSDAGMPTVSDPGYRLATEFHRRGLTVTVAPGASAVTAALAVSGLPSDRFAFEGFLPRKGGARSRRLAEIANDARTTVLFEAANRLEGTLQDLAAVAGPDRAACMCRELTKTYEEILPGTLAELTARASDGLKGEVTLVVAGAPHGPRATLEDLVAVVNSRVNAGENRKDVITQTAKQADVSRRELYNAVLATKDSP